MYYVHYVHYVLHYVLCILAQYHLTARAFSFARSLAGFNGCVFACGQTGGGKTYTMVGDGDFGDGGGGGDGDVHRGLAPRVFEALFARAHDMNQPRLVDDIAAEEGHATKGFKLTRVTCSFLEIYNETITDLLDPRRDNLTLRETSDGPRVDHLSTVEVRAYFFCLHAHARVDTTHTATDSPWMLLLFLFSCDLF